MASQNMPHHQHPNSFSLKKISAYIGLIGIIISVILGGFQIFKQIQQSRKINKEVQIFMEAGDRFAKQYKLNEAIKEYQKILELDKDNINAHRRIISVMRQQLSLGIEPLPTVNEVLSRLYHLQGLKTYLKNDVELLLEEARLQIFDENWNAALRILQKAKKQGAANPDFLALYGYVHVLTSSEDKEASLDLLLKAVERQPDKALHHYYRALALEHVHQYGELIREYYQIIKLLTGKDVWSNKLRNKVIYKLDGIFMDFFSKDGALTSRLDMPLGERAQIYEYLITEYEKLPGQGHSLAHSRRGYLATIYYGLGDLEKADLMIQAMLKKFHIDYKKPVNSWEYYERWLHWFELHVKILEQGNLNFDRLVEARNYLKAVREELKRRESD